MLPEGQEKTVGPEEHHAGEGSGARVGEFPGLLAHTPGHSQESEALTQPLSATSGPQCDSKVQPGLRTTGSWGSELCSPVCALCLTSLFPSRLVTT